MRKSQIKEMEKELRLKNETISEIEVLIKKAHRNAKRYYNILLDDDYMSSKEFKRYTQLELKHKRNEEELRKRLGRVYNQAVELNNDINREKFIRNANKDLSKNRKKFDDLQNEFLEATPYSSVQTHKVFRGYLNGYKVQANSKNRKIPYDRFINEASVEIEKMLYNEQKAKRNLKFILIYTGLFKQIKTTYNAEGDPVQIVEYEKKNFRDGMIEIYNANQITNNLNNSKESIIIEVDEYSNRGSGWIFHENVDLSVFVSKSNLLKAGSFIELPKKIQTSKSVTNVKNDDDLCFLYSVACHDLNIQKNANRVSHYEDHIKTYNLKGLTFPLKLKDVPKFEKNNNKHINVFGLDDGDVYPMYISEQFKKGVTNKDYINLLFLENEEQTKSHYCYINNMSRLMGNKIGIHHKAHFCYSCLSHFSAEHVLQKHIEGGCTKFCS